MSVIVQTGWYGMDYPPGTSEEDGNGFPYFVVCDLCKHDAWDDHTAGKTPDQYRQFHKVVGGRNDGLVVCENCLPELLKETS